MEYVSVEYSVTIEVRDDLPAPTEADIQRGIYQACEWIDTEDAIHVQRA